MRPRPRDCGLRLTTAAVVDVQLDWLTAAPYRRNGEITRAIRRHAKELFDVRRDVAVNHLNRGLLTDRLDLETIDIRHARLCWSIRGHRELRRFTERNRLRLEFRSDF